MKKVFIPGFGECRVPEFSNSCNCSIDIRGFIDDEPFSDEEEEDDESSDEFEEFKQETIHVINTLTMSVADANIEIGKLKREVKELKEALENEKNSPETKSQEVEELKKEIRSLKKALNMIMHPKKVESNKFYKDPDERKD